MRMLFYADKQIGLMRLIKKKGGVVLTGAAKADIPFPGGVISK